MVAIQQKKTNKQKTSRIIIALDSVFTPLKVISKVLPDFFVCRSDILELLMSIMEKQSEIQIPNPVLVEVYLFKPLLMENNYGKIKQQLIIHNKTLKVSLSPCVNMLLSP